MSSSTQPILDAALAYIRQGLSPVPVPFRSKGPIMEDWPNFRATLENAHEHFNGKLQNIGIILGRASNGATDVDLDCPEAVAAARYFLSPTASFGHASKHASHWIYRTNLHELENRAAIKLNGVDKFGLLEVRIGGGDAGAQTVFPPSTHKETGEAIEWENAPFDVSTIDGAELLARAHQLAAAVQFARSYPNKGGRHDAAYVLGGFLSRCNLAVPLTDFIAAVADASGQDGDKRQDMIRTAESGASADHPAGFPKLAEAFGQDVAKKVAEWLKYPFAALDEEEGDPLPLFSPIPDAEPYPIDSLGPVLARAARAIAGSVQVPAAMAGQSVLAAASLAVCPHVDVLMPFGQTRPSSLYFMTVAEGGDRKSTSDKEASWPIRRHEKNLCKAFDVSMQIWSTDHAVWDAEKRHILADRKIDQETRKIKLTALGSEPQKPLTPALLTEDPTIEGLAKNWVDAHPGLGIFTTEGGVFTAGHALNDDNRIKTSAALSALWDGQPTNRLRASDPGSILVGRRLVINIMLQPDVAAAFLSNASLRNQGILSRILIAKPESLAGTRMFRERLPEEEKAITAYGARILSILETRPTLAAGKRNELEPRALPLSPEAADVWKMLHNHIESQLGATGELAAIKDFANKSAENAARIAAVMTIVADIAATEISRETMHNAAVIVEWHVGEADRLQQSGVIDPRLRHAAAMLEWLQGRPDRTATFREILRLGPRPRTKTAAKEALGIL